VVLKKSHNMELISDSAFLLKDKYVFNKIERLHMLKLYKGLGVGSQSLSKVLLFRIKQGDEVN